MALAKGNPTTTPEMLKQAESTRGGFKRPEYWVLAFGWSLGFSAGFVNVLAFLKYGVFGSHVTGSTTQIGSGFANGILGNGTWESQVMIDHIFVLFPFIFGAYLCGLLIDKNQINFGGKSFYGFALVANGILLSIAIFVQQRNVSLALIACACGLQNAMCTVHFGAVSRTTHVTGTTTDMGSMLGRMLMLKVRASNRGTNMNVVERAEFVVDKKKLYALGPMWLCYMIGGIFATFAFKGMDKHAIWFPAGFTLISGVVYMFFRQSIVDAFEKAAQEEVPKELEKVAETLGQESMALKNLLEKPDDKDNKEKFMALALEMERIENTIFDAKENIRIMQSEYGKIELGS